MARLITAPATEPVDLIQVKAHARIETADEDALLTRLITSCRSEIESYCKVAFVEQVWEEVYDRWPADMRGKALFLWAPRLPATSVAIALASASGGPATAFTGASLRIGTGRLALTGDAPTMETDFDGMTIKWTCGYGADTPPQLVNALLDLITYRYDHRGEPLDGIPDSVKVQINSFRVFSI